MGFLDWAPQVMDMITGGMNTGLQFGTLAYQKQVQEKTWEREDNAVQRRMADMEKAGINPVLAAGQAAQASAPLAVTTPQFEVGASDKVAKARALMMAEKQLKTENQTQALLHEQWRKAAAEADVLEKSAGFLVGKNLADYELAMKQMREYERNVGIATKDGVRSDVNGPTTDKLQLKNYIQGKIDELLKQGGSANDAVVQQLRKLLDIF